MTDRATTPNARAAEIARHSYGKLLAVLAAKTRDLTQAEDALAEAFGRALSSWPARGVPAHPEAWLVRVALNTFIDDRRSAATRHRESLSLTEETLERLGAAPEEDMPLQSPAFDRRVDLLFACSHPAIQEAVRTPLMLQTVLGLEVKVIATVYAMPAATLAQRLVRAKRKIKAAHIPFHVPATEALDERLAFVLEAIYAAYSLDWTSLDEDGDDLRGEALYLANLVAQRLPVPEAMGLEALLAFLSARHAARFDAAGALIPLSEQATDAWDGRLIAHGEMLLRHAVRAREPGRFQLEASIQSAHLARRSGQPVDWPTVVKLYQGLLVIAPTLGAAVAYAAAVGEAFGAESGLAALHATDGQRELERFQPYWATRAHLLERAGQLREARSALDRAIAMCTNLPLRRHLERTRRAWSNRE
ncbi:MAG: DUF6596 domain-containing protein [Myxococcota bacterium]